MVFQLEDLESLWYKPLSMPVYKYTSFIVFTNMELSGMGMYELY